MLPAKFLRLVAIAVAAFVVAPLSTMADGIPGVVMTDSQYLTDWSGVYVGGKLGGAFSNLNWTQDLNSFTALSASAAIPQYAPVKCERPKMRPAAKEGTTIIRR